jgi:hypothetical protein
MHFVSWRAGKDWVKPANVFGEGQQKVNYAHPTIRARMAEFLGMEPKVADAVSAVVMIGDACQTGYRNMRKVNELPLCLERDFEVSRSLWDSASLLIDLDIEYVNFDFPAEAYIHPDRAFALQETVIATAENQLRSFGVAPLHLLSGRGHHFIWRVRRDSPSFDLLVALGHPTSTILSHYEHMAPIDGVRVESAMGTAYHGLGRVIEYLAAEIKRISAPCSRLPVELTAVEVGPGEKGREMISLDISQFGDPLDIRSTRVAYSRYLKMEQQKHVLGGEIVDSLAPIFEIPLGDMEVADALKVMRNPKAVAELAERVSSSIPDCSAGMQQLICSYSGSSLAKFHHDFYSVEPDPPDTWSRTYDRTDFRQLPPCTRFILEHPNDLLLRPSGMRRVVLVFLALGWHPRHIAGLIQSKFEGDYSWGQAWAGCDPGTRAELYTRVFAGLVAARYDDLVDFNCQSAREQGTCHVAECHKNLLPFRQSVLDRRSHERLACRPIHRLFFAG